MGTARKLIQNTAALSAGQIGTRALGFVYVTALARHVHPEGMGELATAQSLATIVALLIGLGHEALAISELAHDRSQNSLWFSNLLALKLVLSVLAMGVLLLCSWVARYPPATLEIIMVYGVVMVVGTLVTTIRAFIMARERQTIEAATQFARDVTNIGLSLLAIWLGASLVIIVWVSVLANVLQMGVELLVLRRLQLVSLVRPSIVQCRAILRRGLPFGASAVVSVLLAQTGPVVLSVMAGAVVTGLFWAANNLVLLLLVLPIMYYWAVLPVFSRLHASAERDMVVAYRTSMKVVTVISMPLAVGTAMVADPLIQLLYGPGYEVAATALRILVVMVALSADYVCGAVLTAMGRQRFLVLTYGLELVALLALSMLLIPQWGAIGASVGYAVPRVVGYGWRASLSYRQLHLPLPLGMLARTVTATTLMALAVYAAERAGVHILLLGGVVGPVTYAAGLILLGGVDSSEWRLLRETVLLR